MHPRSNVKKIYIVRSQEGRRKTVITNNITIPKKRHEVPITIIMIATTTCVYKIVTQKTKRQPNYSYPIIQRLNLKQSIHIEKWMELWLNNNMHLFFGREKHRISCLLMLLLTNNLKKRWLDFDFFFLLARTQSACQLSTGIVFVVTPREFLYQSGNPRCHQHNRFSSQHHFGTKKKKKNRSNRTDGASAYIKEDTCTYGNSSHNNNGILL